MNILSLTRMPFQNHMLLFYCGVIQTSFYDTLWIYIFFFIILSLTRPRYSSKMCFGFWVYHNFDFAIKQTSCYTLSMTRIQNFRYPCSYGAQHSVWLFKLHVILVAREAVFFSQGSTFLWVQSRLQIPGETRCLPLSGHTSSLFRLLNSITLCLGESNYRGERLQAELWFAQWGKGSLWALQCCP